MDRTAAETAALKNFLDQLKKLTSLLSPPSQSGTPTIYAAAPIAETAYLIRTLFRQGVGEVFLKRGVGPRDVLEKRIEAIARTNQDSFGPLTELAAMVSQVISGGHGDTDTVDFRLSPPATDVALPEEVKQYADLRYQSVAREARERIDTERALTKKALGPLISPMSAIHQMVQDRTALSAALAKARVEILIESLRRFQHPVRPDAFSAEDLAALRAVYDPKTQSPLRLFDPRTCLEFGAIELAKRVVNDEIEMIDQSDTACTIINLIPNDCTGTRWWQRKLNLYNGQQEHPFVNDYGSKVISNAL